ncbi:leucine-rich repeat-containing protein 4C-like [Adelges cooleyi]|uniref:leucine-rich repeat-containing protein 4C-like n=1 Tax=Adelges cooleyi TaxID=133065 RepID=UPI00217FE96B|nr:leucine-rich repeat-containing protein 4C-like [Adelges cooleyi]XP_050440476.1 leucine-rich repeat-containing protein 4C-like [Adelges cooleyi]XP_050440477.1 leucine-rich repeat-containing protein 4C-like [Adelges cooleyi]XP_050440478.1 leucine-rich repeat-containing protein 4C-like [Adelges cooleyi]
MVQWTSAVITTITLMMIMATVMSPANGNSDRLSVATPGCPAGCSCKWKNGKQTVECVNKKVTAVTGLGIDSATQVLDISDNDLSAAGLPRDTFLTAGLSNLQRIHAARCNMYYVHDRAFRGLTNLVDLDLSGNCLREVPTTAFGECTSLMKLNLAGNPIDRVAARAFRHLNQLTLLDLSRCGIQRVEAGAFDGLRNLDWLKLDSNRLTHVPGPDTLPKQLHGVDLHRNDWQCDCQMIDMHRWLSECHVPATVEPVCAGPDEYAGVPIRAVSSIELACEPIVDYESYAMAVQDVHEGEDVVFRCLVMATPAATVEWLFGDELVDRHNATEYVSVDGNTTAELHVFNASKEDAGKYTCLAENRAGTARANFTVTVRPRPSTAAGSSPPSSSSTSSSSSEDVGRLPYMAYTATVCSVAILAAAAALMAVHCSKLAKRMEPDSGVSTDKRRTSGASAVSGTLAVGYRTVDTMDKEPVPATPGPAMSETALVGAVDDVDHNPDVVNDASKKENRCSEWEIDFDDIVWTDCSPAATGYVSIQIPVQCGVGCLGAYYAIATASADTMTATGTFGRRQRRAVLAATTTAATTTTCDGYDTLAAIRSIAFDDTATAIRTTAQGYPAVTASPPTIIVDTDGESVTPILSPPLPFRSPVDDADDSIAL